MHRLWLGLSLLVVGCASTDPHTRSSPGAARGEVCEAWTDILGDSHQCTNAEGGNLNRDLVGREITQKIVTESYPLPNKEFAQSALVFHSDGTYHARKLRFTGYAAQSLGKKVFLVYAEDSSGAFEVNDDGTIALASPRFSTCEERLHAASTTIYPHLKTFRRQEPFRSSIPEETGIAFGTDGWLGAFTGEDYWSGTVESRRDFKLPPFPKDGDQVLRFAFEGFLADIHYGCLKNGYESFDGAAVATQEELAFPRGIDPGTLHKGTRFIP